MECIHSRVLKKQLFAKNSGTKAQTSKSRSKSKSRIALRREPYISRTSASYRVRRTRVRPRVSSPYAPPRLHVPVRAITGVVRGDVRALGTEPLAGGFIFVRRSQGDSAAGRRLALLRLWRIRPRTDHATTLFGNCGREGRRVVADGKSLWNARKRNSVRSAPRAAR
jgi:hypothetical protein